MTPNETAFREASGAVTATHFPPRSIALQCSHLTPPNKSLHPTVRPAPQARQGAPRVIAKSLDRQQPKPRENIMHEKQMAAPDNTAVRVALWRALHVEVDSPPHVLEDKVGLKLAAPDDGWRNRPDMSPFTRPFRASIVARARFIEDLVAEQVAHGVGQYVILGAGLDTFAQRRA